ncbi:MAG TPA: hypothetical protein VIY26_18400 [Acidimicrobiales bacterium]
MPERPAVLVSRHWRNQSSELSFLSRAIAGGVSRRGAVAVLVPGREGTREPDGAFDLEGTGEGDGFVWPAHLPADSVVVVDDLTPEVRAGLAGAGVESGFRLSPRAGAGIDGRWPRIGLVEGDGDVRPGGPFVTVNPGAMADRHHGFGFTGYVLVLSGRLRRHADPPAAVAWLTSAFHDCDIVVVEDAVASAWKGRSLRGTTPVETRMDLWRLVAHAAVCVDLAPGAFVARECVEALRLGTPIVVPAAAPVASSLARACGGGTFSDTWGLIEATDKLQGEAAEASARAKEYGDATHGDPEAFVAGLRGLLALTPGVPNRDPGPSRRIH